MTRAAIIAMLLVVALIPSGCDAFRQSETEILQAGFIEPDRFPPPLPIFCYRTLAEADCFAAPQPGEAHRLIGAYVPVHVVTE